MPVEKCATPSRDSAPGEINELAQAGEEIIAREFARQQLREKLKTGIDDAQREDFPAVVRRKASIGPDHSEDLSRTAPNRIQLLAGGAQYDAILAEAGVELRNRHPILAAGAKLLQARDRP